MRPDLAFKTSVTLVVAIILTSLSFVAAAAIGAIDPSTKAGAALSTVLSAVWLVAFIISFVWD